MSENEFPKTIKEFGYEFNKDDKLRKVGTDESFEFVARKNDHDYNQRRYEALGELVTPYVYELLESRCGLKRKPVPVDAKNEPSSFVFCSDDAFTADNLLVLIHGSGVVRAGQWARRLILNDSLNSGTQVPFIERARREGFGVLVMNTNDNKDPDTKKKIRGSENPQSHGLYVWRNYVQSCAASNIVVVAHSFGGIVLTNLAKKLDDSFFDRVSAVAMTDSVHQQFDVSDQLAEISRNWVTSTEELDTEVLFASGDVPCVSAGCDKHELTSSSSMESIFHFFESRLSSHQKPSKIRKLCHDSHEEEVDETEEESASCDEKKNANESDVEETEKTEVDSLLNEKKEVKEKED